MEERKEEIEGENSPPELFVVCIVYRGCGVGLWSLAVVVFMY